MGIDWRHPADTAVALAKLRQLAQRLTDIPVELQAASVGRAAAGGAPRDGRGQVAARLGHGGEPGLRRRWWTKAIRCACRARTAGRGTFAHRHAVLHDQNREKWDSGVYLPLQNIRPEQANFLVIDSLLSEEAVLGFEYGYATAQPFELVIWEGAVRRLRQRRPGRDRPVHRLGRGEVGQRMCGLTMFLPHGFEGQGPEHSSARLERFLQLCAEHNIQVVRAVDCGAVLPHDPPPGRAPDAQAAHRDDAQEPAAQEGGVLAARGSRRGRLPGDPAGDREARRRRR